MPDRSSTRLDALELQAMDAELAQAALDAVVIRHSRDLLRLQGAIDALQLRLDAMTRHGGSVGGTDGDTAAGLASSLTDMLERELPPHY